jgi:hypothetical protein
VADSIESTEAEAAKIGSGAPEEKLPELENPAQTLAAIESEMATIQSEFNSAALEGQNLQAVATQLNAEVETMTAEAAQSVQMSNAMTQAASDVLATALQENEDDAKA